MNILVLGGGGREHAIVWKLAQSPRVKKLFCIPGNAGIESLATCADISLSDFPALLEFIRSNGIELTVVGPEQPLSDGIADFLESNDAAVFGPGRAGAQIEGSKSFAKELMQKYEVPTATFKTFSNSPDALSYLDSLPEQRIVVKADGLAAGKGVVVCDSLDQAREAARAMLDDGMFSSAGASIVIEECMEGEEVSLFVITDGDSYVCLTPAQDFKRAHNNDQGKNTGGMGSYSPTPYLDEINRERTIREIVNPMLNAFRSEGIEYKGVLYCGLMITEEGPKVVEFNCRFGDPETQVVLPMLKTDLLDLFLAVNNGTLNSMNPEFYDGAAVGVILASGGYPDDYDKGREIGGLELVQDDVMVFHAGTVRRNKQILTNGGRVLAIAARGETIADARDSAYGAVSKVKFNEMHYRTDIALKASERKQRDV